MSFEKESEIYSYTLTLLNLTLKVKFPCKVYIQYQGRSITAEVAPTASNKFIFNQEVSLKNQSDKQHLELLIQLLTEKGSKYVGGVIKLTESDLVASEGECMAVSVSKCLDTEAKCQLRVDQVSTSRVVKKGSPKRQPLRSQYHPEANLYSSQKPRGPEGETKSEYNFPISIARKDRQDRSKEVINIKAGQRAFGESRVEKEGIGSTAGGPAISSLEFEVYKEGYNKLKEKYRKETETARTEMNKRLALENNQNNLKLQTMRYKLKAEELEKTVAEKTLKIKQLGETITSLQKKELDSKYLKEEVENKSYIIKSLEETIKSLNRDNNELKTIQAQRYQTEQQILQSLRDEIEKAKKDQQSKQAEFWRELKIKNDAISKLQYNLHQRAEELERAKCNIEDLDKTITNKTFEWEKVLQGERSAAKLKQEELHQKIASLVSQMNDLTQTISQLQAALQHNKAELSKLQYDKKVVIQNSDILYKENEELRAFKDKYSEVSREFKVVSDDKLQIEKAKERETKSKDSQINELTQTLKATLESSKKSIKDLQEKLRSSQFKTIQVETLNESLGSQLDKLKRQFEALSKDNIELKNQLKECKADIKTKEDAILSLTSQITNLNSKCSQGEQSSKLQINRMKEQADKLAKALQQQKSISKNYEEAISELELAANNSHKQWQLREEKALKELGYSKDKVACLEAFRADLEAQAAALTENTATLKNSQKLLTQKIQQLELEAIKAKETNEKLKKDVKILEEKQSNSEASFKLRLKECTDLQAVKQSLEKQASQKDAQIANLKNELSKQVTEKNRHQKVGQILQKDLAKAKEDQTKLNAVISAKDTSQLALREQLKKEKEEYTKLDMKLNALRKQLHKFKETLVDNINTVFSAIPEGLNTQSRQVRSTLTDKSTIKENADVLTLLNSMGRDARLNMAKALDQLKQAIRDNQRLTSDYSSTVNKSNSAEFEHSQALMQLQEEMNDILELKNNEQNRYEEEIFLLEGRLRQKDATISDLTQQVEQFHFLLKNTKTEFEAYRQEAQKKQLAKSKLVEELRQQIEYQNTEIDIWVNNSQRFQQSYEASEAELASCKDTIDRLTKEATQATQNISQLEEALATLKKQLKRAVQRSEELSMNVAHNEQQLTKYEQSLQEEEKKSADLREFLNTLMKQKEEVIKNELEKSEKVVELQTLLEQLKHQAQSLDEANKKSKIVEEQQKETVKKLTKALKDQQSAKLQQQSRVNKLTERLKDKEKEVTAKDDMIGKLQEKLRKEGDKKSKDIKELEAELDHAYAKLLAAERQSSQRILALQNLNERLGEEKEKLTETNIASEESLFRQKSRSQELKERLAATEAELSESEVEVKGLTAQIQTLNEQLRINEEQSFKLQGKINLLEMKLDLKQSEGSNKLQDLNEDWASKYYSMEEDYEQKLDLLEKEVKFLKEKLAESDKEIKKLTTDLRSQEASIVATNKSCEDKVKSLEQDRLQAIAHKNTENQRLVDEVRVTFEALKLKQSECRKLSSQLQLLKANLAKTEARCREAEEKIRNLNRSCQLQAEQMRRKEQAFKKLKQSLAGAQWKAERETRKTVQNASRQIIELVDQKNTIRVMEVTKTLEQSILAAISLRIEDKEL